MRAQLFVTAATAAATVTAPPSSGDVCGTFYFPGKQITYQSTTSGAGQPRRRRWCRTYDANPVTFNGQSATRIVDTPSGGTPSYTMISDGATSWSELGGRSTSNGTTQETYFSPPDCVPGDDDWASDQHQPGGDFQSCNTNLLNADWHDRAYVTRVCYSTCRYLSQRVQVHHQHDHHLPDWLDVEYAHHRLGRSWQGWCAERSVIRRR